LQKKDSYQSILRAMREALLLEFLYESFPDRSRKSIKSLLEQKQIMILNQIVTRFDYPLAPGMDVIILKKKPSPNMTLRKMNLLYEDEHLLVIEKSAGLLSVATAKENEETAFSILKSYVKKSHHHKELYVLHRLDRDTSGIMMFAKSKEIQLKLQDNWENAVTKRIYYAVVEGHVKNAEGEIVSCLKENKSLMVYFIKNSGRRTKSCYPIPRFEK
jgi:23S rRNA pseudouridine1911/1915/1917 synthase